MPKLSTSIYAVCRRNAGYTQEEWADALHCSVETIKAYELRMRVPANYTVLQMVRLSGQESLALQHLQETAECLDVVPQVAVKPLPMAVISLCNRVMEFAEHHRDRQLLKIAEDGVIDAEERPLFDAIVEELAGLIGAAYQVKYAEEGYRGQ